MKEWSISPHHPPQNVSKLWTNIGVVHIDNTPRIRNHGQKNRDEKEWQSLGALV